MDEKPYADALERIAAGIRSKYNLMDIELADYIYMYVDDSAVDRYPAYKAFWAGVDELRHAVEPEPESPYEDLRKALGLSSSHDDFAKKFGLSPDFDMPRPLSR